MKIAEALEVGLYDLVPNTSDGIAVFNNNDNFINFNLIRGGSHAFENEITSLLYMLEIKNKLLETKNKLLETKDELLEAKNREIDYLKEQIVALQEE